MIFDESGDIDLINFYNSEIRGAQNVISNKWSANAILSRFLPMRV